MIDENLSWKDHIHTLTTKISKTVGLIAKLRHIVPNQTLLNIYKSLIVPYITYGLTSWGNASDTLLNKVLVFQNMHSVLFILLKQGSMQYLFSWKENFYHSDPYIMRKLLIWRMTLTLIMHQLKFRICFPKLLVFILTTHAHWHLSIFLPNNPHLRFKVTHFQVLVLKSGMGYQLDSKTYPEIVLSKLLEQN